MAMEQTLFEFKWSQEVNGTVVNDVTLIYYSLGRMIVTWEAHQTR